MAISTLDHYSIRTLKLDETRALYVDVLGLAVGPRPPFKFPGVWLYRGDQALVHVVGIDPANPSATTDYLGIKGDLDVIGTGTLDHVAFLATGVAEMRDRAPPRWHRSARANRPEPRPPPGLRRRSQRCDHRIELSERGTGLAAALPKSGRTAPVRRAAPAAPRACARAREGLLS
jgi:catechol 2,3-dioxygenase-like lactoylglutathione lyase family enzyme